MKNASKAVFSKGKKRIKKCNSQIDPRTVKFKLQGTGLPGISDFQSELDKWRKGESGGNFDLFFWTRHFDRLLTESLSALSSCLDHNVSQEGLLMEAEEMLREPFIEDDLFNPTPYALISLRNTALAILIFLRRVALQPSGDAYQKEMSKKALVALKLIEKWHSKPKGRVARKTQRKRKRGNAPTRKYSLEFQAKCIDLIKAALREQADHIVNANREPAEPFTPSCFQRSMPLNTFGVFHKDLAEWTKWLVDMLAHRARKGDLCTLTFRKRKSEIMNIWIPSLWDQSLNF